MPHQQLVESWLIGAIRVPRQVLEAKDILTILLLVMWEIWKHRNAVILDSMAPSANDMIGRVASEGQAWKTAGLIKMDLGSFFGT